MIDFLKDRKQRTTLNGCFSTWKNVKAGVPQGFILGPLLFLIYINDLPEGLSSNTKIFADDTSIFSNSSDPEISYRELTDDLMKIKNWAYQWKMSFNPEPSKQAQEVIFSHKLIQLPHQLLNFNDYQVNQVTNQKHLGLILDCKLNFDNHFQALS